MEIKIKWIKRKQMTHENTYRDDTCAILAPNSGTESEILSRHLREYDKFYKYGGLMRISEIFLLENLSINVPYHRLTLTIVCLNFYSGNLSGFQYFDRKGSTHEG